MNIIRTEKSCALDVGRICKTFRKGSRAVVPALVDVSFTLAPGTFLLVTGPNGSGKTTLLRILSGVLLPDSGTVCVFGADTAKDSVRAKRYCGLVTETHCLYDSMYTWEYLCYFACLYGLSRTARRDRIAEVLDVMKLLGVKQKIGTFSKGMRQRLCIARALLNTPDILFLDEPSDGLDVAARTALIETLDDYQKKGRSAVIVSHRPSELEAVSHKVAILNNGELIRFATPAELRGTPRESPLHTAQSFTSETPEKQSLDQICNEIILGAHS